MSRDTDNLCLLYAPTEGKEREACHAIDPVGFYIRHPPEPHLLNAFITPDDRLFHTIHMGAAVVDSTKWIMVVDGLVARPFSLSLGQLKQLPRKSVTAFHECYGSPLSPPINAVWRIGNVTWTGVPLMDLLALAQPLREAAYVWSDGLDHGTFGGVTAERYQKDLPMAKALSPEVLVAYEMNGDPLSKERGGPVRLVVPGWFGTNMTKWLCRLSLQNRRAEGPYTTKFYNEIDPMDPDGKRIRPVWEVEVNSVITRPEPGAVVANNALQVEGWAWCNENVTKVLVSADAGASWSEAKLRSRVDFEWQRWNVILDLVPGEHKLIASAISESGHRQPISGRRNHAHSIPITVLGASSK
ncbi:sulfite reductase [NADPH] flavoprotein alpha-component [Colletotrichum spaethianum]|uniref:Sulfite reductase [NADPH] flavoprotein alpha-component n=1 Tax=Colletotrichum spaethianum TaxID=700344 RepID=A0AA37LGD5_9PEZI|nr:sulfite reductase [NADPH] flavoprotein alpha-component [Colletotrichum spaethianum]GKT45884.1 sulfite reductase [NADPH] flavoprotein alpha-component [Colletotrichum spaethianum]